MEIVAALRVAGRAMDDDELATVLGVDRREVVRRCRRLAFQGILIRDRSPDGRALNRVDQGDVSGDGRSYFEHQVTFPR